MMVRVRLGEDVHPILVNVSPLMHGHGLIIPWPDRKLNQRLLPDAVRAALDLTLLSGDGECDGGFRVGFNSLGAFSSVNHLHLHVLYPDRFITTPRTSRLCSIGSNDRSNIFGFPIERAPTKRKLVEAAGDFSAELMDWIVPCFAFSSCSVGAESICALKMAVSNFLGVLRQRKIPHNMLFVRTLPSLGSTGSEGGVRVIIIPRRCQYYFNSREAGYNAALGEISGLIVCRTEQHLEQLTESNITERMAGEVSLEEGLVGELCHEVTNCCGVWRN